MIHTEKKIFEKDYTQRYFILKGDGFVSILERGLRASGNGFQESLVIKCGSIKELKECYDILIKKGFITEYTLEGITNEDIEKDLYIHIYKETGYFELSSYFDIDNEENLGDLSNVISLKNKIQDIAYLEIVKNGEKVEYKKITETDVKKITGLSAEKIVKIFTNYKKYLVSNNYDSFHQEICIFKEEGSDYLTILSPYYGKYFVFEDDIETLHGVYENHGEAIKLSSLITYKKFEGVTQISNSDQIELVDYIADILLKKNFYFFLNKE